MEFFYSCAWVCLSKETSQKLVIRKMPHHIIAVHLYLLHLRVNIKKGRLLIGILWRVENVLLLRDTKGISHENPISIILFLTGDMVYGM